jgi:hypothetical protein
VSEIFLTQIENAYIDVNFRNFNRYLVNSLIDLLTSLGILYLFFCLAKRTQYLQKQGQKALQRGDFAYSGPARMNPEGTATQHIRSILRESEANITDNNTSKNARYSINEEV